VRRTPIVAGIVAGAALGLAGVAATDLATEGAEAQSGGQDVTAQIEGANLRSQRGIKQATSVWNQLGIYLAPEGTEITAKGPRVSQQKAVGGGLPITVLDQETQDKINQGGPTGATGPQGPVGPQGPQGPTDGSAISTGVPDPFPTERFDIEGQDEDAVIQTTVAGRLHVTANFVASGRCDGPPLPLAWITLDGEPIPSSLRAIPEGGDAYPTSATGITASAVPPGAHTVEVTHGVFPIISHKQFSTDQGGLAAYLRSHASGEAIQTFAPITSYRVWVKAPPARIPADRGIPFLAIPRHEGDNPRTSHPFEGRIIGDGFALDAASQQTLLEEGVQLDGIVVIDGTAEAVPDGDVAWAKVAVGGVLVLVALGLIVWRPREPKPATKD